ncbi:MAG: ABC transporter ATP-binding protein [Pseudomonadota bacterium]
MNADGVIGEQARLTLEGISVVFDRNPAVSEVALSVAVGEIVCLLGPSGCGKSTTLRVAAGVERQTQGRVLINGAEVSNDRLHLPPEERAVGLMFQDFALFPHLTVAENVGFGLKHLMRARERRPVVERHLEAVGLLGKAARYPHQLSGGEQQRVALARALAPGPQVMLMDEPFSGLDTRLRDEVREETLAVLRPAGAGVLLVTHEPDEAMRMADRIALMRDGRIVQIGAPYNVYNNPADRAAAAFFSDINVVSGRVRDGQTETPFGLFLCPNTRDGTAMEIVVRPQHLTIQADQGDEPTLSPNDGVPARGRVIQARFVGAQSLIDVAMEHDGQRLRATVPFAWLPEAGAPVWLSLRRDRCFLFPRETAPQTGSSHVAAAE